MKEYQEEDPNEKWETILENDLNRKGITYGRNVLLEMVMDFKQALKK